MDESRRRWLFAGAGGGALAIVLNGCGGSGGGAYSSPPSAPPTPAPGLACGATAITLNHGHSLTIPAADVDSTVAMTYSIEGTAGHVHMVTLSPAQLAQIKSKNAVTVTSTLGGSPVHSHDVTINCA